MGAEEHLHQALIEQISIFFIFFIFLNIREHQDGNGHGHSGSGVTYKNLIAVIIQQYL